MKRKVRKYVEGGYGDVSSEDYGMGSREEMIERNIEENERRRQMAEVSPVRSPQVTRATTVDEFAEPGTAGFSRTAIKTPPKTAAKPAPKPAAQPSQQAPKPMGRTAMGKTAEQEMAAIEAGKQARAKAEIERLKSVDKPLEPVAPEAALLGGPGLKALRSLGSGIGSKAAQAAKPRVEPRIPQEVAKQSPAKPPVDYYYGAKQSKPGELTTKAPRGAEVATKGSEPKGGALAPKSGQLARRGKEPEQLESPKRRLPYEKDMGPVEYAAAKNKRRLLDRDRRSDDVIESRKSGGKVGSASRRADGIASRGKTRGRYI
jgi:hypothetical protein